MAERAKAFSPQNADEPANASTLGAAHWIPAIPNGEWAPAESGVQTMYEFDPQTGKLSWSDEEAARRILGAENFKKAGENSGYEGLLNDKASEVRASAIAGKVESYACAFQLNGDEGEHWIEERGGWIGIGSARRLISVIRSIEGQRRREEQLSWLATNDELTGLLNRTHLRKELDAALTVAKDKQEWAGAYLLAGVDDLGAINADFGFEAADKVIVEISKRLANTIGASDRIGRVAGTKFGILIAACDEDGLRETCVQLLNAVREAVVDTSAGAVASSISIGAVHLPEHATEANAAMAHAEAALDAARRLGKSSWSAFSEKTDVVSMRRRNTHMSDVILTALNERRIELAFQPIVADLDEAPRKYECLIRMRGEDGKEIPAPEFIPAAERLGLVHLLDRRVLELATNTLMAIPDIHLGVNISMETVKDFVWAEGYLSLLRANKDVAPRITVELTETQIIDAIDASIEFVSEVKKLGSSFAIDDFGAGYTSFRNLKALDIDILKIDGSFVTGVSSSRENQLFVRTLLDLARNFGMQTVAEWVDNEADAMLLKGLGVDFLQGYLIGKPETCPEWLPDGAPNDPQMRQDRI